MTGNYVIDERTLLKGVQRAAEHFCYLVGLDTDQPGSVLAALWTWVPLSAANRSMSEKQQRVQLMKLNVEILQTLEIIRLCKQSKVAFTHNSEVGSHDITSFHSLLFHARFFLATDPRDRMYGLLGLVHDTDVSMLYVDYERSLADVSARVSLHMIRNGFASSALVHAVGNRSADVPSWSMDFDDKFEDVIWRGLVDTEGKCVSDLFNASGSASPHIYQISNTLTLSVRAILIGPILSYSDTFISPSGLLKMEMSFRNLLAFSTDVVTRIRNIIAWIEDAHNIWQASKGTSEVGTESFHLACWRTIMSDVPRTSDGKYHRLDSLLTRDEILLELSEYAAVTLDAGLQAALPLINAFPKMSFLYKRRMALADTGPCHVPDDAKDGDQISIVLGCPIPVLFRKAADDTYRLIGSCYVHGMMDGQALNRSEWPVQDIVLS